MKLTDKERLDWLSVELKGYSIIPTDTGLYEIDDGRKFMSLRKAIDAAMKSEAGKK